MRALFTVVVTMAISIVGCSRFPYMNLREPIYLVAEDSLFSGCEQDLAKQAKCRDLRLAQVRSGVDKWLQFFKEETRPWVAIVESEDEIPNGNINLPIHLKMQKGFCQDDDPDREAACYTRNEYGFYPEIVFEEEWDVRASIMAHEFGHALGLDHYDNPDKTPSIMSAKGIPENVTLKDVERVCRLHRECPLLESESQEEDVELEY